MSEFLILFAKGIALVLYGILCIGLIASGGACKEAKHGIPLIISGVLLVILGYTFEIYGLEHWWLQ